MKTVIRKYTALVLCIAIVVGCLPLGAMAALNRMETSVDVQQPLDANALAYYNQCTDIAVIPNSGGCGGMQGMAVGSTYMYTVKVNGDETAAFISATNKTTGAVKNLLNPETGGIYFSNLRHANGMTARTVDGAVSLFVTTARTGSASIIRLERDGNYLNQVAAYRLYYKGKEYAAAGVEITKISNGYIHFLFKIGNNICTGSVSTSATTADIDLTIQCTLDRSKAYINGQLRDFSDYLNQSFGYHDGKIFLPATGRDNMEHSVILCYDIENATGTVYPDRYLSFEITSTDYPNKFEIEDCGISSDGRLYFNTNRAVSDTDYNHDGVHVFDDYVYSDFHNVHIWDNGVCKTCGEACDHSWSDDTCGICGLTCTHTYGDWAVTEATCTEAGLRQRTCTLCGTEERETIDSLGHDYTVKTYPASCLDYEQYEYTCGRCGNSYRTYFWSEWSETRPTGVDNSRMEAKLQYRYSDLETMTSYEPSMSGYTLVGSAWEQTGSKTVAYVDSWPSGFDTSHSLYAAYSNAPVTAEETATTKTVINSDAVTGYLWYHWCYSNSFYSVSASTGSYTTFHAFYSTADNTTNYDPSDGSYEYANSSCCSNSDWYWKIPVYTQKHTTYNKQFTYGHWTDYTDWSDTAVTASETRQVETRTVYRYITTELGEHTWDSGKETTPSTCITDGIMTYTCAICGNSYTDIIPTADHSFVNGKCGTCGIADPGYVPPVTAPTVKILAPGLAFKDEVFYNVYFSITNPDDVEIVEMGLISWTSAIDGDVTNAEYVCPGATDQGSYWQTRSQAIAAKNMGEQLYFKAYARLADGSYVYSDLKNYSARDYCTSMISKEATAPAVKSLCVALMNYGAAAQEYFGYKTDDLMNAGLTAEQQALAAPYSADMIPALVDIGSKADGLAANGGFLGKAPSVSFGGALGINYNFKPANTITGMKLYVWTEADAAAVDALTLENASQVIDATAGSSGIYTACYSGIAPKNAGDTVYACGVYELDGVTYYSGLITYSVSTYCGSYAVKEGNAFQDLAATAAIYTYYADAYLNG